MTIVLENVKPFNWSIENKPLPQALRITGVVEYYRWNLVLTAEDIATKKEYLVNIPAADISKRSNFSEDAFREEMRRTAEHEKNAALQACGCMPAGLAASQKGISIPVYTGEISGLDQIHSVGNIRIYGTVGLMEGAVRNFGHLSHRIGTLDEKARDYMAYRLLMVALKLEQAGVAHLELDWSGLFLREDGLLGNFGSAAPFGHERPFLTGVLPRYPEPNVIVQLSESGLTMPEAKTNMWHLGILLFHLYTGNQDSCGGHMGRDAMQEIMTLSKVLLEKGLRSNVLIPELEASNVPRRWVELIVRLLEPTRAHRISGFQVVREFPDLINQQAE
ncbi:hypothetical protein EPH_0059710 [Eimeria praecox]|uniref:Protein kinase domain-containing protein n=1 Tax=Eimeria praecox TaxID=51316 RepID=U6H048_9EIME|nr:hypothetical protein EPH_0059710 [Eimeria praecox]